MCVMAQILWNRQNVKLEFSSPTLMWMDGSRSMNSKIKGKPKEDTVWLSHTIIRIVNIYLKIYREGRANSWTIAYAFSNGKMKIMRKIKIHRFIDVLEFRLFLFY